MHPSNIIKSAGLILLFLCLFVACTTENEPASQESSPTPTLAPVVASDWRDIGTLEEQTKACIAPTIEDYYVERSQEFGGNGPEFSLGRLGFVLDRLPYGDCTTDSFPLYELTTCDGSISFGSTGGFTTEIEYFSLDDGALIYAKTSTDFNAFCNNVSFDVAYGNKPTDNCESQLVTYCNLEKDMIMSLYENGELDKISDLILTAQE